MKILIAFLLGGVIGTIAAAVEHRDKLFSTADERYYVALKFANSGKLLQLSEKVEDHYACLNSADYMLHKMAADTSGSKIICTNQRADY
jgi:hypothetical protein